MADRKFELYRASQLAKLRALNESKHPDDDAEDIWANTLPPANDAMNKAAKKSTKDYDIITDKDPIPSSNIGYKLLQKMGWNEHSGLGKQSNGRLEPVMVDFKADTMGLGKQEEYDHWTATGNVKRPLLNTELQETIEEQSKRIEKAGQLATIKNEVKENNKTFYCALCNKQYKRASELDVHLSSYDHNHKKEILQRMKDAKQIQVVEISSEDVNKSKQKREEKELRLFQKQMQAARQLQTKTKVSSIDMPSVQPTIKKKTNKISFSFNSKKK